MGRQSWASANPDRPVMINISHGNPSRITPAAWRFACVAIMILAVAPVPAGTQPRPADAPRPAAPPAGGAITRFAGVWVEGPGYDVTYGGTYETCAQRCLAAQPCVMIEFYRPEKKCNLYDALRPRKTGGASDVGIRN